MFSSRSGNRLLVIQYCPHVSELRYRREVSLTANTWANPVTIRNVVQETEMWSNCVAQSYFKAPSHKATILKPPSLEPNIWSPTLGFTPGVFRWWRAGEGKAGGCLPRASGPLDGHAVKSLALQVPYRKTNIRERFWKVFSRQQDKDFSKLKPISIETITCTFKNRTDAVFNSASWSSFTVKRNGFLPTHTVQVPEGFGEHFFFFTFLFLAYDGIIGLTQMNI